jgi:predicted transcriptional regulator
MPAPARRFRDITIDAAGTRPSISLAHWRWFTGVVQLPDDLKRVIDRQSAEGRAASEAEFLSAAVHRYAQALELDEDDIATAADEGIADMAAGRFELISSREDMRRLHTELVAELDQLAEQRPSAGH